MPTNSSNTDTNHSNSGRVQNSPQMNGNSEVTTPDDQRGASTAVTDSNRPSVYTKDLEEDPRSDLSHLAAFYDNPQTNGNESKT
ncbi:hypothetical protein PMIN04_012691 [Paraphaeosphaeria minitans]|uniref:Uncharacterized protein n=1 Tax=Paraphaeosphaeria minitans TaxID=565426 RepID=A0A9P6GG20_9PLEO|nr:hypothetical protein PMIN01_08073 [Paraphaeosphaeria minitans]